MENIREEFLNFIESDHQSGKVYSRELEAVVEEAHSGRLYVDIGDLRLQHPNLANGVLDEPAQFLPEFDNVVKDQLDLIDPDYLRTYGFVACCGIVGDLGPDRRVTPRQLSSNLLGKLVTCQGIVTKVSLVRPKVVTSVHYCEETKKTHVRGYRDVSHLSGLPTQTMYPTRDEDGNPLTTEYGLCQYQDHQVITLQEMPEHSPCGQLPRSVDCIVENDLVEHVKPGDRVSATGVFRAIAGRRSGSVSGVFRTVLIGNSVGLLKREKSTGVRMEEIDIIRIRNIAQRQDVFDVLSHSIAPSICGHSVVKKSILLLLLGGREKILTNGTHLRGDINILMVGDPSTAKSQLLRFVMKLAPLAVSTTGKGSSGVGLTAAVQYDPDSGDRQLVAGAMVLADRGVVCIDEFDKMSDVDRVAMHEVMEQQTVTIAKAGVHTSLNARCSVLAAANPVYGNYDTRRRPMENIGLPDSLLSRFDLLFIVLDGMDADHDRRVASHVLKLHRYISQKERRLLEDATGLSGDASLQQGDLPGEIGDELLEEDRDDDDDDADEQDDEGHGEDGRDSIFQKFNALLHERRDILKTSFLRKYIAYAKRQNPTLSDEANEVIIRLYSELRAEQHGSRNTLPITPRMVETLIRLSTAHAKARLSPTVDAEDVQACIDIIKSALYQEDESSVQTSESGRHPSTRRRSRRRRSSTMSSSSDENHDGSGEEDEDSDEEDEGEDPFAFGNDGNDAGEEEEEEEEEEEGNDDEDDMDDEDDEDDEDEEDEEDDDVDRDPDVHYGSKRSVKPPKRRRKVSSHSSSRRTRRAQREREPDVVIESEPAPSRITRGRISAHKRYVFRRAVQSAFQDGMTEMMTIADLMQAHDDLKSFTMEEAKEYLAELEKDNRLMLQGDNVHLI